MRTELRLTDKYALIILSKMRRRKGYATWREVHRQMVGLREVKKNQLSLTRNAVAKLHDRGALIRISCASSDGRYAYKAK